MPDLRRAFWLVYIAACAFTLFFLTVIAAT
jgi:hypothetical protein